MKVTHSCPTLCDPTDYEILQARILEWVYPLQWDLPSPGDLPNPGIKPRSPTLQVDSLQAEPQGKPLDIEEAHFLLSQMRKENSGLDIAIINHLGCRSQTYTPLRCTKQVMPKELGSPEKVKRGGIHTLQTSLKEETLQLGLKNHYR